MGKGHKDKKGLHDDEAVAAAAAQQPEAGPAVKQPGIGHDAAHARTNRLLLLPPAHGAQWPPSLLLLLSCLGLHGRRALCCDDLTCLCDIGVCLSKSCLVGYLFFSYAHEPSLDGGHDRRDRKKTSHK